MIVLVKLSARRYLAIDAPRQESAWTSIEVRPWAEHDDDGFVYSRADIIAGPADLDTCYAAMAKHAAEKKALVRYADWKQIEQERSDALKQANADLQARRKQDREA
jgi:hypothetical protein